MSTDEQVAMAVPPAGAERALQVFNIMSGRNPVGTKEAMGRSIVGFFEWLLEQGHEERMEATLALWELASQAHRDRSKYRREAQELVSK